MSDDPVPELIRMLGLAVLINWPKGVKGTSQTWGYLTLADMTPAYLAKLRHGNIGVALGEKSGGLCAIDCDRDNFAERFLSANPQLQGTLQTHGARGRVFWVRFNGDYPKRTSKLKACSGEDVGEFRSNGAQSIVWGIHPHTQKDYEFVVKQPTVEIKFDSIRWPDEITNPPHLTQCTEEPEDTLGVRKSSCVSSGPSVSSGASVSSVSSVHSPGWFFQVRTMEDALRRCLPDRIHQNNHQLFVFARALKALELSDGKPFTPAQLRDAFDQWYTRATPFLRPGQSKEDYFIEFLNACRLAKYPLGSIVIPRAWKLAQEQPLPPEAMEFETPQLQLLVALCRQLQISADSEPFYLSSRTCQTLFGHDSHSTAAKWLRVLCALQILEEVEKGKGIRASRYFYLPLTSALNATSSEPLSSDRVKRPGGTQSESA